MAGRFGQMSPPSSGFVDKIVQYFWGTGVDSGFIGFFNRVVSVANMVLSSALMWMIFVLMFRNNMPLVVVLSNSMAPDFWRGDLLLATGPPWGPVFPNGRVCAYNTKKSPIPIVHRMIETHISGDRKLILTKGDANTDADYWLYPGDQFYVNDEVETQIVGILPCLGWVSIAIKEDRRASIIFILFLVISSFVQPD
jgi:signal peptidase